MDSTEDYKQAVGLCEQARGLMSGGRTKWLFFTEKPDYTEAGDLFTRAGNLFKTVKAWREAGEAFLEANEAAKKEGEPEEAARKLVLAASSFKKVEPTRSLVALEEAVTIFLRAGRFNLAASHEKEMGEICEAMDDLQRASVYYQKAAERYIAEDQKATALTCQLRAGNLAAQCEEYGRAIDIFGEVIEAWAGDELKRYSMKDYLFRQGLCLLLAGDLVRARRDIEAYPGTDGNFPGTAESRLLLAVLEALETNDMEAFEEAAHTFDAVGLLDDWRTKMLFRLKRQISDQDDSLA